MDEYNFYKYIDDKSILVITPKNRLIRIRCPFAVMNTENKILQVDSISGTNGSIYFRIRGKYELYKKHRII